MATKTRRPPTRAAADLSMPALEPVTVARLEQCTLLLERLLAEKTSVFANHANRYRAEWRAASERALSAEESASIASGLAEAFGHPDPLELVERIQRSGLRAQDEPARGDVFLSAGAATAPAFLDAALRLVALIELDGATFEDALEGGSSLLEDAIAARAAELRRLRVADARARAERALTYFAEEAGTTLGETLGLVGRMIGEALTSAMSQTLGSSSLTGSLAPTDGADDGSSMTPDGETP